jgi:hypothetical protein
MKNTIGTLGVILCILCSTFLFAQGPDTLWTKTYGGTGFDYGRSVQQTTDDGYIIAGRTNSFGAGGYDVYLIKTDSNGDTLWTKTYGGTGDDYGESMQQTTDNGYIVGGYTHSFGAGNADIYLIKTDSNGDTLWTKTYGGTGDDCGHSVQQAADSGYIISGYTESFGAGGDDVWLLKTDVNGDTLWTKTYGGGGNDKGKSVQQTTDSGYIISGYTESFGADSFDVWLLKTDVNGDTLWTKTYGGTYNEFGYSVQQTTPDNGYIIAGYTGVYPDYDVYLVKTDVAGDTLWTKTYGGTGGEQGYSVQQTIDNGYIIAGCTQAFGAATWDAWLIKTDDIGDTLWLRTYGGEKNEYFYSVQQTTPDNGYIIVGITGGWFPPPIDFDVWLLRIAGAVFSVTPTSIDFGNVYVDSSKTDSIMVTNIGSAQLDITSVVSDNPEFTITPTTGSLEPAQSMEFYITFTPINHGAETGNIIFTHNATSSPDTITVTGTGIVGEASILNVIDIPNDQGRWVRVTWAASPLDQPGSINPITLYGIWRRIDEDDKGYSKASKQERNSLVITAIEDILEGWDAVGTVPAIQDSIYNFVSPTLVDSNASGINYSVFIITAHTQDPELYYISDPDSGYSVDNIPPETPYNLAGEVIDSTVLLTWQIQLSYPDFSHFAVYRDTASGFTPGDVNRIGTSEVPTYMDTSVVINTYYYVVSALDINGNESDFSNEEEVTVTGIKELEPDIPTVYALSQNCPNPFKTETRIHYQLPKPSNVTIAIYNVSGQRIKTLVDERKDVGYYTVHWDGQSQDNQIVSNGVYFCRMVVGQYVAVRKILLTR